jgi:DNA-directed RNA polymerase subunit RPC12/RpoP
MTKYFCDRCGKELQWRGMYNGIANIATLASEASTYPTNCSGYKTYIGGDQWADLCSECEQKFYENKQLIFSKIVV